jgi:hypothetical protein
MWKADIHFTDHKKKYWILSWVQFSLQIDTIFRFDTVQLLVPNYPVRLFAWGFLARILYAFPIPPYILHDPSMSHSLL